MHHPSVHASGFAAAMALALTGCGGGGSTDGMTASAQSVSAPAAASTTVVRSSGPALPTGTYMVQGNVYTATTGAAGSVAVNLWIQTPGVGYSYWYAHGPTYADAAGHFIASNLPGSEASLEATGDAYRQPCAVMLNPEMTQVADIELVTVASLNSFNPVRPQSGGPPALTGLVYETTASGRVPVPGAELWAEKYADVGIATTRSDLGGRFYLCRLPKGVNLFVSKAGYKDRWLGPIDGSASQELEVELTRQ